MINLVTSKLTFQTSFSISLVLLLAILSTSIYLVFDQIEPMSYKTTSKYGMEKLSGEKCVAMSSQGLQLTADITLSYIAGLRYKQMSSTKHGQKIPKVLSHQQIKTIEDRPIDELKYSFPALARIQTKDLVVTRINEKLKNMEADPEPRFNNSNNSD